MELQSCCVFVPKDTLPCPCTIVCGDIPGTVRSWYYSQASMPGTLVICLPQVSVMSAGHRHMEPLQEIPFTVPRPVLEEGIENTHTHTFNRQTNRWKQWARCLWKRWWNLGGFFSDFTGLPLAWCLCIFVISVPSDSSGVKENERLIGRLWVEVPILPELDCNCLDCVFSQL